MTAASPSIEEPLRIDGFPDVLRVHSRVLEQPLYVPRRGIMLHYDDSVSDHWSLEWFFDPRCANGYTWIVLRTGRIVELANPAKRTPHAGACLTPNANSVYYGLSAATDGIVCATPAQMDSLVACCKALFAYHKWSVAEVDTRIVGHDAQAIWTKANTTNQALWGQHGRKVDPTGTRRDGHPIIDIEEVRHRVARP